LNNMFCDDWIGQIEFVKSFGPFTCYMSYLNEKISSRKCIQK
jgi:hypothetical protein